MTQLLLKMAQQASKDKSLLASLVQGYAEREGLSWEQIATRLGVEAGQLARLALCKRPRSEMFTEDIAQIAGYVGADNVVLTDFLRGAKSVQPLKRQRDTWRLPDFVTALTRRKSDFMFKRLFKRPVWALGIAALVILLLATFVFAQPVGTEATLVVAEGEAFVTQAGRTFLSRQVETTVAAGEVSTVGRGDTIRLAASSTAQLRLQDGSTVELFGGTTLAIAELITDEDAYQVQLDMLAGKTINRVVRLLRTGDGYEVRTPSSTASVRGTVFTVEVISPEITYVAVDEGIVHVQTGDQQANVTAGNEVTATAGRPLEVTPQVDVPPAGPPDQVPGNPPDDVRGNPPDDGGDPPGGPPDEVPGNPPDDVPGNLPDSGGDPPGNPPGDPPAGPPDAVPGDPPDDVPGNPPDAGGDPPGNPPDNPPAGPPDAVPGNPPDDVPGNPPDSGGDPPGNPPDDVPGNPPDGGGDPPGNPPDDPPAGPPDEVPGNPPDDVPGNPPGGGGDPPRPLGAAATRNLSVFTYGFT